MYRSCSLEAGQHFSHQLIKQVLPSLLVSLPENRCHLASQKSFRSNHSTVLTWSFRSWLWKTSTHSSPFPGFTRSGDTPVVRSSVQCCRIRGSLWGSKSCSSSSSSPSHSGSSEPLSHWLGARLPGASHVCWPGPQAQVIIIPPSLSPFAAVTSASCSVSNTQ